MEAHSWLFAMLLPSVRTQNCSIRSVPSEGILSLGFLTDPNYKFRALNHNEICPRDKFWGKSGKSKVEYKHTVQTSVYYGAEVKLHYIEKVIFQKGSNGGGESSGQSACFTELIS